MAPAPFARALEQSHDSGYFGAVGLLVLPALLLVSHSENWLTEDGSNRITLIDRNTGGRRGQIEMALGQPPHACPDFPVPFVSPPPPPVVPFLSPDPNGRLISGFARGIPREYQVHNVPLSQSRARFEEVFEIIVRAWTEEVFSYEGEFWSYKDAALWPRPLQQPRPPIWMPIVGSKESIEFAAKHDLPITPGLGRSRGLRDDIICYYARCLARAGHRITPDHLSLGISAYVADSKAEAVREMGPYHLYFNQTLFSHGNFTETELQRQTGYSSATSTDYVSPENQRAAQFAREDFRGLTMADVERQAEQMPWGTAAEVTKRIIEAADSAGADNVLISLNRGVLPHEMFMEQIRRFARDVLPALQAHKVERVPLAEEVPA